MPSWYVSVMLQIVKTRLLCLFGIFLLAFAHSAIAADDTLGLSPGGVQDEAFWKAHIHQLQKMSLSARAQEMTPLEKRFDVTYYIIRLKIDPSTTAETIDGAVTVFGSAVAGTLDTVQLDFSQSLTADSVTSGASRLDFQQTGDLLTIALPGGGSNIGFALTVHYRGQPQNFGFGSFKFESFNSHPTVSTLSEPYYARGWWPCKDHPTDKPDSVDMYVTIDSNLIVASNGSLVSIVKNGDGTNTTHWHESYPIATYLVSLAIADYYTYSDTLKYGGFTMPIDFFHYGPPGDVIRARYAKVKDMIAAFSDMFGIYPFIREKYGHAEFTFGGGMEHQTCTSLGAFDENVIAHELAHQWWGDMVTCGSWHDIWLNEGFASYGEALWAEHTDGMAGYHAMMNTFPDTWDTTRARDTLIVTDTTSEFTLFNWKVYRKGGYVLHMLRYTIGDSAFFRTLHRYGEPPYKYSTAVTEDFRRVAEEESGQNLETFFQQWVYSGGQPYYHYGMLPITTDTGVVTYFFLDQVQAGRNPFQTDIDVRFDFADTALTFRLSDTLSSQNFVFRFDTAPISCTVDPDHWILQRNSLADFGFRFITDSLPDAYISAPYSQQLIVAGGRDPLTWWAPVVTLPPGLTLSFDGILSGTPTETGQYLIGVRVTDASSPARVLVTNLPLNVKELHGNVDGQPGIGLSDLIYLIRYLFKGGNPPANLQLADTNCDGAVDLVDVVVLLNYLYDRGPLPCATFN